MGQMNFSKFSSLYMHLCNVWLHLMQNLCDKVKNVSQCTSLTARIRWRHSLPLEYQLGNFKHIRSSTSKNTDTKPKGKNLLRKLQKMS